MSAIYRQPGTYLKSGHNGFDATSAPKDNVGCFEIDGTAGLVSITREMPPVTGSRVLGAMFAVDGPDAGSLTGTHFRFGVCPSHARRYGQASEYVLTAGPSAKSATYTARTYAFTSPTPNVNYQWDTSWWANLINAGTVTTNGSGFGGNLLPRVNQDFSDGYNASHTNCRWVFIALRITKTSATTHTVAWRNGYIFVPQWYSKLAVWDCTDDTSFLHARYAARHGAMLATKSIPANDNASIGTFTTTAGLDFNFLNIAWECPIANTKLLVRDIYVGESRDSATGIVP